ncbi:hypothetical protein DTO027I6_4167 [Penicillium roqueforti]|uniref:uncharacterized protein n=1 Tax=Penicillium roqueforti TaxID=5082 RepID=UPI00190BAF63|nr:uncharacterized protein LCP9604111_6697 [Penicillium roqueforti]KAF9246025.1 hypothetical protein LCP9604111_6697 [Penicillium roqueforti]KAI3119531.1 hypothetical protein CBS147330_8619 [Penicillium roqueforti]KAI3143851.1 hypothetical protein CBS147326_855 [Penicillium roqueforti]KAI3208137.1 hypothetical protein CBS147311_2458 [Penicillium roqueforti]KAI3211748.1 hypothetical protein DTO027I6_4167 [Penicillium roqueforti]
MPHRTMRLPRIPDLSLPSFRELDESVEANKRNQPSLHLSDNMYDGTGNSSSSSPQKINTIPNPYPPYPANGWLVPPDPSRNAFREPGFTYQDVSTVGFQPNVNVGKENHIAPPIPLRLKEAQPVQASTAPTQSTLNSAQTTLRDPRFPSTQVSSTPKKISSNPIRAVSTNRVPPNGRQMASRDAAANHRSQRRRVGVNFSEVAAHTAKCDVCNKRNKNGMSRCQNCGWQVCRKCLADRNGDHTHASFGAIHVPEGGGDMPLSLPSLDGTQDRLSSESADVRAAKTLLDLGSFGNGTPSATSDVQSNTGGQKMAPARGQVLEPQVDTLSTDSDMTMSVVGDEWPHDESDIPIGEDGLPVGYIIARRNPARAARPATKLAE